MATESLCLLSQPVDFPQRLARIRKERGLTQQQLADAAEVHVVQLRRYEGGKSQPTLDVLRRLAITLSVSADLLLFGQEERGPDETLRLQFEAVRRLNPDEKKALMLIIEGILLQHQHAESAQRLANAS